MEGILKVEAQIYKCVKASHDFLMIRNFLKKQIPCTERAGCIQYYHLNMESFSFKQPYFQDPRETMEYFRLLLNKNPGYSFSCQVVLPRRFLTRALLQRKRSRSQSFALSHGPYRKLHTLQPFALSVPFKTTCHKDYAAPLC